jgi:hypothetical protein
MWMGSARADTIKILPVNDEAGLHSWKIFETASGEWAISIPGKGSVGPNAIGNGHSGDPQTPPVNAGGDGGSGNGGLGNGGLGNGGDDPGPTFPPILNPPDGPPISNPPVDGPPSSNPPVDGGGSTVESIPSPATAVPEPGSVVMLLIGAAFLASKSSRWTRS